MYGKSLSLTRDQFIKFCTKYYQDNVSSLDLGLDFSLNNNTCKTDHKEDIKLSNNEKEIKNYIRFLKLIIKIRKLHEVLKNNV